MISEHSKAYLSSHFHWRYRLKYMLSMNSLNGDWLRNSFATLEMNITDVRKKYAEKDVASGCTSLSEINK